MKRHPMEVLAFAAQHYPEAIELVRVRDVTVDSARKNGKRPAYLKIAVTDDVAKQIRGKEDSDLLLFVCVPKDVVARQDSRIVLPGESR